MGVPLESSIFWGGFSDSPWNKSSINTGSPISHDYGNPQVENPNFPPRNPLGYGEATLLVRPWVLPPKLSAEPMFWVRFRGEIYGEAVGFSVVNPTINIRKESDVAVMFLSSQNWALRASLWTSERFHHLRIRVSKQNLHQSGWMELSIWGSKR